MPIRIARQVAAAFALVALMLLGIAVALALVPVHVPGIGDSSPFRCTVLTGVDDPTVTCASHIVGRLRWALVAGCGSGVAALVAFGIIRESAE